MIFKNGDRFRHMYMPIATHRQATAGRGRFHPSIHRSPQTSQTPNQQQRQRDIHIRTYTRVHYSIHLSMRPAVVSGVASRLYTGYINLHGLDPLSKKGCSAIREKKRSDKSTWINLRLAVSQGAEHSRSGQSYPLTSSCSGTEHPSLRATQNTLNKVHFCVGGKLDSTAQYRVL